jgi:hypothetical protein
MDKSDTPKKKKKLKVEGVTESGESFRPADWAERIGGSLSTFHNQRIQYSPLLSPTVEEGIKCLLIDPSLKENDPQLYEQILKFVTDNKLKMSDVFTDDSNN